MVPRGIILSLVNTNTASTGRTLHSFLCEAVGAEHLDATRYAPIADTRTAAENMAAIDALDILIAPRRKRR